MFDDEHFHAKPVSSYSVGLHRIMLDYQEVLEGLYLSDGFYRVILVLIEGSICAQYEGVENLKDSRPPSPFELNGCNELIYAARRFCAVNRHVWGILDRFKWFSPHKHSVLRGYLRREIDRFNTAQLDRAIPYTHYSN